MQRGDMAGWDAAASRRDFFRLTGINRWSDTYLESEGDPSIPVYRPGDLMVDGAIEPVDEPDNGRPCLLWKLWGI